MERQCHVVCAHLDSDGSSHHRVVWMPLIVAKVNMEVPSKPGWVVAEVWHATRSKGGEKNNEHWEFSP
jgi:hypothetical protein